ncbi:Ubiquitin-conjugating enzyme E2 T [Dissophora ornata]|nr:Ubiquitin-conjugating enzyme E2 T [Dissophora ornata]
MATVEKRILIRMRKELRDLEISPPQGAICYPLNDNIVHLQAELNGPTETPYEGGTFKIEIHIPERYPFEPPRCQFLTRVYHPNIDDQGRICLNILKCPPKGTWGPAISITTMLMSLRILLANPNPDDPLLVEVANEFNENRELFNQKAREFTKRFAIENGESGSTGQSSEDQPLDSESTVIRLHELETSTNSSGSTRPLLPTPSSSSSSSSTFMSTSMSSHTGSSRASELSTSFSTSSIPLQVSVMERRSLTKPLLKKPSLKSKRANVVAVADPNITNNPSSEMEVTATERPVVTATLSYGKDASIHMDEIEDGNKALISTETKGLERIENNNNNNNVCITSGTTYPSLSDTVASTEIPISETKRKLEATLSEPLAVATKPTMSKKLKSVKTRLPNDTKPVEGKKEISDHLSQTVHDPSSLSPRTTPLPDSSCARVESEGRVLLAGTPLTHTKSRLQRSSSSEKSSKEPKRHISVKCGPLQPIDPPIVQSRFFSFQNTLTVDDALAVDTRLAGDCNHEKGDVKDKEEKSKDKGKDKDKGKIKAAEEMRPDKGKGRAVESVHTRHDLKETDENDAAAAVVATSIFGFSKAKSPEKCVAAPSLPLDTERTPLLTVARKRNLLKKQQRPT